MALRIEPADLETPRDREQLIALLDLYSRDPMGDGRPLPETTRAQLVDGLRRHPASLVLLAWHDRQCVGLCISFEGFSTFQAKPLMNIHDLVVDPAWRNRGVGRALLAAVEATARRRDCCKITLEVRADNAAAQHLYRSFGFGDAEPVMHFWHKVLEPVD